MLTPEEQVMPGPDYCEDLNTVFAMATYTSIATSGGLQILSLVTTGLRSAQNSCRSSQVVNFSFASLSEGAERFAEAGRDFSPSFHADASRFSSLFYRYMANVHYEKDGMKIKLRGVKDDKVYAIYHLSHGIKLGNFGLSDDEGVGIETPIAQIFRSLIVNIH